MKKTEIHAKKEILEKFNHLTLIEFYGNSKNAVFRDSHFGYFTKLYSSVLAGKSSHPLRGKENRLRKRKKTNLEKYGVEHAMQNEDIKAKVKNTNLEKYGVANPMQNTSIKNKAKETNLKKYGVENPMQCADVKDKVKKTNLERYGAEYSVQISEIKDKIKESNLKKFGVENPMQNEDIKDKVKKTNLERYGVKYPIQIAEIKEKIKETNLKKYGVEHAMQNEDIKDKVKKTNLERYGVENPMQKISIQNKAIRTKLKNNSCYNVDGYTLRTFFKKKDFNISYSWFQQNFKKNGKVALQSSFYNTFSGKSKVATAWLTTVEKELGYKLYREYHIPCTRYHADGYDPKTNTVYEFYGDYWHGNPKTFNGNSTHPLKEMTYSELYNKTITREQVIIALNYNIVSMWESEFC